MMSNSLSCRIRRVSSYLKDNGFEKLTIDELNQIADEIEVLDQHASTKERLIACLEKVVRIAPAIAALIEAARRMKDS